MKTRPLIPRIDLVPGKLIVLTDELNVFAGKGTNVDLLERPMITTLRPNDVIMIIQALKQEFSNCSSSRKVLIASSRGCGWIWSSGLSNVRTIAKVIE